jgi:hypothetical protein
MAGIIRDGSDTEFRAAKTASSNKTVRPSAPAVVERHLPKMGAESRVVGGSRSLYSEHMQKKMSSLTGTPSYGANVATSSPEIRNPLLNLVNFYLPYDRKTLNQWIRYYDRFHPYVGNCLDIHGEFPISDWRFTGISDAKVVQLYETQKETADMLQYAYDASREYELLGESFSFWNFDEDDGMFSDYATLNPDLLEIQTLDWGRGKKTIYTWDPPAEMKELVSRSSTDNRVRDLIEQLDPVVRENLYGGKAIPLDDFNVMAMIRKADPYDARGTSIVLRCIKELMYEDKLREAQYAIADQQITPIQLWKLGDPASGYMPTEEDLQDFRNLLLAGRHDPLFTIVSHGALALDLIGYTGKLLPVIPEFEWVAKRIMVALFTNESMVTGEGPTYSNAIVAMKILQGRYQAKRERIEKNFKRKIFEPLAKHHQIFDTSQAELAHRVRTRKKFLVPGMEWNFKLDLTDQTQRLQYMMQLHDKTSLPMKVICEVLDLDYNVVKQNLKDEEGTVFDPVYQSVRSKRAEDSGKVPDMSAGGGAPGGGGPIDVGGGGTAEEGTEEGGAGGEAPPEAAETPPEAA